MHKQKSLILKILLVLFVYFIFTIISYRGIFFSQGVVGHNWDWSIPYLPQELTQSGETSKYVWIENFLGYPISFGQSTFIFNMLVYGFGLIGLGGEIFGKLFIFSSSFLSSSFFFLLLIYVFYKVLKIKDINMLLTSSFLGGLFYGFSPFLYNELNGGALTQIFTYVLIPLNLLFYLKYISGKKRFNLYLILSSLVLTLIGTAVQNLIFTGIILILFTCYDFIVNKNKEVFLRFLYLTFLTILFSSYWLLPTFVSLTTIKSSFLEKNLFNLGGLINATANWREIIIGMGYFRDFYTLAILTKSGPVVFFSGYVLLGLSIIGLGLSSKISEKYKLLTTLMVILYIVSAIFSVGGREPFGSYIILLYKKISLFNLFRTVQHFITLTTFSLAFIFSLCSFSLANYLYHRFDRKRVVILFYSINILFFVIVLNGYYYRGDLGMKHLKAFRSPGNYIDMFNYPNDYKNLKEGLSDDVSSTNLYVFPPEASPKFLKTSFQHSGQGGDPFVLTMSHPTIAHSGVINNSSKDLIDQSELYLFTRGVDATSLKFFSIMGVKYLLFRNDVISNFGSFSQVDARDFFKTSITNYSQANNLVSKNYTNNILVKLDSTPRIYASSNLVNVNASEKDRIDWVALLNTYVKGLIYIRSDKNNLNISSKKDVVLPLSKKSDHTFEFKIYKTGDFRFEIIEPNSGEPIMTKLRMSKISCKNKRVESVNFSYDDRLYNNEKFTLGEGCYELSLIDFPESIIYEKKAFTIKSSNLFDSKRIVELWQLPLARATQSYSASLEYMSPVSIDSDVFIWRSDCKDPYAKYTYTSNELCLFNIFESFHLYPTDKLKKINFGFNYSNGYKGNKLGIGFSVIKPKATLVDKLEFSNLVVKDLHNPYVYMSSVKTAEDSVSNIVPLSFGRISPTKYSIKINGDPKKPFVLFLGQAFDANWVLKKSKGEYLFNNKIYDYKNFNSVEYAPVSNSKVLVPKDSSVKAEHISANIYGNGWILDPSDPAYTGEYVIEYSAQNYFVAGLIASLLGLVMSVIILFFRRDLL